MLGIQTNLNRDGLNVQNKYSTNPRDEYCSIPSSSNRGETCLGGVVVVVEGTEISGTTYLK